MPAAARPRQQAYNDLSECCAHEGEAGTDKSAKVPHSALTGSQILAVGFTNPAS